MIFFKLQSSEVIAEDRNKNWFQEKKIIFVPVRSYFSMVCWKTSYVGNTV